MRQVQLHGPVSGNGCCRGFNPRTWEISWSNWDTTGKISANVYNAPRMRPLRRIINSNLAALPRGSRCLNRASS